VWSRRIALLFLIPLAGCASQVQLLSGETSAVAAPAAPLPMTVAIGVRAFEATGIKERGLSDRFASALRDAKLFQAVMYPIPAGANPRWELQLLVRDSATEPNSNFWKSAVASAFLPAAFVIWLESEYMLSMEVLFLQRSEILASYTAESQVRYRWQLNANKLELAAEGAESVIQHTVRQILAQLVASAPQLTRSSRAR
jgi:hypothetical protein